MFEVNVKNVTEGKGREGKGTSSGLEWPLCTVSDDEKRKKIGDI